MATSETAICNLALQKLGAARIDSLDQDHPNARSCNAAYEAIRDREMRAYRWHFAKKRANLLAHATAPADASGFANAFPLPTDFLRLLSENESNLYEGDNGIDWKIELHEGVKCLMTNRDAPVHIVYLARIEDPTLYDPMFVEALAAKLAWHMCEEITQSNQKKDDIHAEYQEIIRDARRTNAFESLPAKPPEDTWLTVRR